MADKNMNTKINVDFEESTSRQSLNSGDSLPTLFGKVKKFFSDLKIVAFSGSYNDLSDIPETAHIAYGTCSTSGSTSEKIITISDSVKWELKTGSIITVKFTSTNTASNPTFNVNNTGAKPVWYNTSVITSSNLGYAGTKNRPLNYVYDGTQYVFIGWSYDKDTNTTYSVVTSTNNGLMSPEMLAKLTYASSNIVFGVVQGNNTHEQQVDLGFKPTCVIISINGSTNAGQLETGYIAFDGYPAFFNTSVLRIEINDNGFIFDSYNKKGNAYYIAFTPYVEE